MKKWISATIACHYSSILFVIALQLGCGLLVTLQPRYFQQLVSLALAGETPDFWSKALPILVLLAVIYCGVAILQGIGGYVGCRFSFNLLSQIQTDFFEHIGKLPLQYFEKQSAGEFFTRFNNDIGQTQRFFADFLPGILREFVTIAVVAAILYYNCPVLLTTLAMGIVLSTTLLTTRLNGVMGKYAREQRDGWSKINRVFDETVQGIDTIKALAAEKLQSDRFLSHTAHLRTLSLKSGSIASTFSPGIELIGKLGSLALIIMAYFQVASAKISSDGFLLFFFYLGLLQSSSFQIVSSLFMLQSELTGIRHLAYFFQEPTEIEECTATEKAPDRSVDITISGLTFGFPNGRRLYSQADLLIPSNSTTLIFGESGSGKSTLINLLLRFYIPHEGTIFLGDVDITRIPHSDLRRTIGVVTQNHFIFQDTLRANLQMAKPEASDQEILHALERAHLKVFGERLPSGLDTILDPRGKGMSAGERQRISIARLLLRKTPIMILDEPWSNLDAEACNILTQVINGCKIESTVFILSHVLPSNLKIDYLYYLDTGNMVFNRIEDRVALKSYDSKYRIQ